MLAPGVDGISNTVHPVEISHFCSSSTEFIWTQNFVDTCGTKFYISVIFFRIFGIDLDRQFLNFNIERGWTVFEIPSTPRKFLLFSSSSTEFVWV